MIEGMCCLASSPLGTFVSISYRIAIKRESAVSKEVLAELNQSSGKKLTKAEKDERYVPGIA